jgi:hypothetical protein
MTRLAIMQPTYLSWLGYFSLMDRVDYFVFLDSVQFERRSWQQRNRIKKSNGIQMLTVPVLKKGKRDQKIFEVEIDPNSRFREEHENAINSAYASAPYYKQYAEGLLDVLKRGHTHLAELNIDLISFVRDELKIETDFCRSSDMDVNGSKADLLADICQQLDADEYVSPVGARGYMEMSSAFADRGIKVSYHDYLHPHYSQLYGTFEPYMSAIDLLFNEGDDSRSVLRSS